jgi:hypothetical protein
MEEGLAAVQRVQAAGLIPEKRVQLCIIGDGTPRIWRSVQAVFASAVKILDYYHCYEHLPQVAVAAIWEPSGAARRLV